MSNFITFKNDEHGAWFWANEECVADSLHVIFENERFDGMTLTESWHKMDSGAKKVRMRAIDEALHDITLDEVRFENREACRVNEDISNLYDLFMVLHEHPSARLTHVFSRYADGVTAFESDDHITVEQLLKKFAHFIAEDILDIEAEVYSHANDNIDETSPVEDFESFMKAQYGKHKDRADAMVEAYNYIANDIACTHEADNDSVNHPKHYQASNGLEAIDCIEAFVEDLPGDIGYLIGNAMKYLCRFDKKGKPVEDLHKAKWYIERVIKNIESRKM